MLRQWIQGRDPQGLRADVHHGPWSKTAFFATHEVLRVDLHTGALVTAARIEVPVAEVEEDMPRDDKGRMINRWIRRAVDESCVHREGDLERVAACQDPDATGGGDPNEDT